MHIGWLVVAGVMIVAGGQSLTAQDQPRRPARDRDVISRVELMESAQKNQDLLKAVRSLRPHYLRPPPGVRSMTGPPPAPLQLYVDGIRQAEVETLVLIRTIDTEEVRYLEPGRAQDLYGITHNGGAIQVKLFRGPGPALTPS